MGSPFRLTAWLLLLLLQNASAAALASLDSRQLKLLEENHYLLQNDGMVRHASNSQPVRSEEIPYLIQRLESVQRLKALLRLDLILSKSRGEKHLTDEERQAIRAVVRENWPILAYSTRKKFKNYFSPEELASMNSDLPAAPVSPLLMKDPDIPEPGAQIPAAPQAPAPPPAPPAAALPLAAVAPPLLTPARFTIPEAAAPIETISSTAAAKADSPPVIVSSAPAAIPAAVQTPVTILPVTPPPLPETAPEGFVFGQGPEPQAPPPPPPPVAPITPVETPPPAAPAAAAAPLEETSPTDLEKFLLQAPYGRDAKAMIRLLSRHAPAAARTRALSALRLLLPQVSLDSEKAKDALRSRLEKPARENQSPLIVLRPAVVIQQRKRLFFGATETALPETTKNHEVPYREEQTRWGKTRVFEDGSRRVVFSLEQQAGLLLADLLRLDVSLREPGASIREVELCARTAQMIFYSKLEPSVSAEQFLDPELRHDLRLWREHPGEYRSYLAHSLPAYDSSGSSSRPSAALAEALEAEKQFRQEQGNDHEKK